MALPFLPFVKRGVPSSYCPAHWAHTPAKVDQSNDHNERPANVRRGGKGEGAKRAKGKKKREEVHAIASCGSLIPGDQALTHYSCDGGQLARCGSGSTLLGSLW